jgi:hypothetical protein
MQLLGSKVPPTLGTARSARACRPARPPPSRDRTGSRRTVDDRYRPARLPCSHDKGRTRSGAGCAARGRGARRGTGRVRVRRHRPVRPVLLARPVAGYPGGERDRGTAGGTAARVAPPVPVGGPRRRVRLRLLRTGRDRRHRRRHLAARRVRPVVANVRRPRLGLGVRGDLRGHRLRHPDPPPAARRGEPGPRRRGGARGTGRGGRRGGAAAHRPGTARHRRAQPRPAGVPGRRGGAAHRRRPGRRPRGVPLDPGRRAGGGRRDGHHSRPDPGRTRRGARAAAARRRHRDTGTQGARHRRRCRVRRARYAAAASGRRGAFSVPHRAGGADQRHPARAVRTGARRRPVPRRVRRRRGGQWEGVVRGGPGRRAWADRARRAGGHLRRPHRRRTAPGRRLAVGREPAVAR